ncbi:hypothetical protein DFP72DRAFT_830415 [Ephemerocybe angulata]|uniref:Uncharacterized protein n=1 Tax=Ephemerocybe angulata TaxID=980116 RepID=A0A8H6LVQ0_9AGAR|nr:hypothetical protein DFP72DRAFT_830415 [Tulosesus angulatus]
MRRRNIPNPQYHDALPAQASTVPNPDPTEGSDASQSDDESESDPWETLPNYFGLFRRYTGGKPSYTPDILYTDEILADTATFQPDSTGRVSSNSWWSQLGSAANTDIPNSDLPVNPSVRRFLDWFWDPTSRNKTYPDADKLVKNVIQHPEFTPTHFDNFRGTARETEAMDTYLTSPDRLLRSNDGWIKTSIDLPLLCTGISFSSENDAPIFQVEGMYYRKPLEVLKSALTDASAVFWHFSGYQEFYKHDNGDEERVITEAYNSDAFLTVEAEVKMRAKELGSTLEACVVGLKVYSDSAHCADFGVASVWPIYFWIANISKFITSKPTLFCAHHLAYIPKLPDNIQQGYKDNFGIAFPEPLGTYLRRDLFQRVWGKILDPDFVDAYHNGFEFKCVDGTTRLLFPRILSYSADYPEKCLVACIRQLREFPCPCCLVRKDEVPNLGMVSDDKTRHRKPRSDNHSTWYTISRARKDLFKGRSIRARRFLTLEKSLTPSRSAFSEAFEDNMLFSVYALLVPDPLHEFELGTWRDLFVQLVRMATASGREIVVTMNTWYRTISAFGRGTIRKFANNAAEMKKLGARDFEDLLQCSIPVFLDLFASTRDNTFVRRLLFEMATWHALSKLRLHTKSTVSDLRSSTKRLGSLLRQFVKDICPRYATRELRKEAEKRTRRAQAKNKGSPKEVDRGANPKSMNLVTAKLHALGHYADSIMAYGTTDNTTTQTGELQHRNSKRWYARSQKRTYLAGITRQECRERRLFQLRARERAVEKGKYSELLDQAPSSLHHQMSHAVRRENCVNLPEWVTANAQDPALKDFVKRLKTHLLLRLQGKPFEGDEAQFTQGELNEVIIENDTIYRHKVLRVNYTTYDMRRAQDSLNPRTSANIMMLAHDDDIRAHPYWYAQIIGIYHARVIHNTRDAALGVKIQHMEFLWVRWLGLHTPHRFGWREKHLPRIGFINERGDASMSFGFLDPAEVIRAVHLIPSFKHKKSANGIPKTIARPASDGDLDWNYFYVNIFVDRDMFMRYRGGGIGHVTTRAATNTLLGDRDDEDLSRRSPDSSDSSDVEMDGSSEDGEGVVDDEVLDDVLEVDNEELLDDEGWEDIDDGELSQSDEELNEDDMADLEEGFDLGAEDGEDNEDEFELVGFDHL